MNKYGTISNLKHEANAFNGGIDLTTKYISENIDKSLIIFCNPISGNREGQKILRMMNKKQTGMATKG